MTRRPHRALRIPAGAAVLLSAMWLAGCHGPADQAAAPPPAPAPLAAQAPGETPAPTPQTGALANTEWRLVEIQSMDDSVGTVRPDDPSLYTMRLGGDGTVSMRLNCNRAMGTWKAEAGPDGSSGRFEFGPLATTRAFCPPPSLDVRFAEQAQYVRSYLLKDGRLHLSLMADGGILSWAPLDEFPFESSRDPELEAAILEASPSYTREVVDAQGESGCGRYVYSRVDLNGDGKDEALVYVLGPFFCGSGGCTLLLLTPGQGGYVPVNEFPITGVPVIVAPERTGGWRDLWRLESGGGATASYVRHTFDGQNYVERARTPAGSAPAGTRYLAGDVAFQKGIPLEPRPEGSAAARMPAAPEPSTTGFSTVCGVAVGGKEYRYECTVEGVAPGSPGATVLYFPDNVVTITWLGSTKATATFAGMQPRDILVSTADGMTRFPFEDRVYFYASDRTVAAAQLETLR